MHKKSWLARKIFGKHLKELRTKVGLSVLDLSYILGVSHATVYDWEIGYCFPISIVMLKKIAHVLPETPQALKRVFTDERVRPSEREWRKFQKALLPRHYYKCKRVSVRYIHKDSRDDRYRLSFGRYLRRERRGRSITAANLARALNLHPGSVNAWEERGQLSRDFLIFGFLDRLYGNALDVLFGICPEHGIHLRKREIEQLDKRICDARKPVYHKPSAWTKHHMSLYKAARRWAYKQNGLREGFANRTAPQAP